MLQEYLSPDGLYVLALSAYEMRMSHWVENPHLRLVKTNETLFQAPSLWSADTVVWSPESDFVHMSMRVYPGRKPGLDIWLYPATRRARVEQGTTLDSRHLAEGNFEEIIRFLNAYETGT